MYDIQSRWKLQENTLRYYGLRTAPHGCIEKRTFAADIKNATRFYECGSARSHPNSSS